MQLTMQVRMEKNAAVKTVINVDGDKESDEYYDDEEDGKQKGRSICSVSFSNLDLANLVNGWPGNPVELRPFDCHFTLERIIYTWIVVGFLPMMGNAVNDPKVRHELGDGGAPSEAAIWLEALHTAQGVPEGGESIDRDGV